MSEKCAICGLPKEICTCEEVARETQEVKLSVMKRRYGKLVTLVKNLDPSSVDLDDIAKKLKTKLACGGTVKNGVIELQGDHKNKIAKILEDLGISIKT